MYVPTVWRRQKPDGRGSVAGSSRPAAPGGGGGWVGSLRPCRAALKVTPFFRSMPAFLLFCLIAVHFQRGPVLSFGW